MRKVVTLVFGLLWCSNALMAQSDVLFASLHDHQNLATRINCQVEEEQHFRYISEASLWDSMGGKIFIEADILLQCLGADLDGKYGREALKYNVQISNLKMSEGSKREEEGVMRRRKRDAREFFSNSWKKVKNFFNRMLGRSRTTPKQASGDDPVITDRAADNEPPELSAELSSLYTVPFQVVQLGDGSIPEIRFSENEVEEGRVKNFKRHLADAFATQLRRPQPPVVEESVLGEHTSAYNISVSGKKSNYNVVGSPDQQLSDESVIVVNKMVTTDDIIRFAPSDALNDKGRMDLRLEQLQMFRDGKMTISRGTSSLSMVTSLDEKRRKRSSEEEGDATSYIRTQTSFDLQLKRRRLRRSAEYQTTKQEGHTFKAASRIAEVVQTGVRRRERERLADLQESADLNSIVEDLISGRDSEDNRMQSMSELMKQEIALNLYSEANSLCNAIRGTLNLQVMKDICRANFSVCQDYLQLIALAGGPTAEEIFLHFLVNSSRSRSMLIADILSDISRPSTDLIVKLGRILSDGKTGAALSISLGHLASTAEPALKDAISDLFSDMLQHGEMACDGDPDLIDLLEAVGNLKSDRLTDRILEVSGKCRENSAVQIASIHALRHSAFTEEVVGWMEGLLKGDCDVAKEVIGSLVDKIHDQQDEAPADAWPRVGFNKVDEHLRNALEEGDCASEDVLLYFGKKKSVLAGEIVQGHNSRRRKRRALWDDLNCQEWREDNRYNPIQKKEEFASDRDTYNKRKSCLAFRRLGVKGANAEIYAGMFAGLREPSDPPKYKLFTKFVSGFNFLGEQIEVGSFYFYLYSGKTKAYVRIMGRTRQEFTNDGCTPTELRYRPLKHIPLYLVSIGSVQLSLGIHLSSQLSVDTLCPRADIYQLQPLTNVRIGGEALGTVGFIRGAANLGANFNYKLQFTFTPTPNMCLKGSHGFDPMNINFESYFQLWNSVKQDWGKTRVWKPSFMSWELKEGQLKQWFDDTCIALQTTSSPESGSFEREME